MLPPVALQVLSARMRSANREGSSMSRVYANSSLPVPGVCHVSECSNPANQSVSQQLFHGPAPRSPLHWLSVRFRRSRSNTQVPSTRSRAATLMATLSIACKPVQYRIGTVSGFSWC